MKSMGHAKVMVLLVGSNKFVLFKPSLRTLPLNKVHPILDIWQKEKFDPI
jgi:hypothetical protein